MRSLCLGGFTVAVKGVVFSKWAVLKLLLGGEIVGGDATSRGTETGEWEIDSCVGVNRRSFCDLPTEICDQLSMSDSKGGILEYFGWVFGDGIRDSCWRDDAFVSFSSRLLSAASNVSEKLHWTNSCLLSALASQLTENSAQEWGECVTFHLLYAVKGRPRKKCYFASRVCLF